MTITPEYAKGMRQIATIGKGKIVAMAWLDADTIAVASQTGLYHYSRSGEEIFMFRFNHASEYTFFALDHRTLFIPREGGVLHLHDTRTGRHFATIPTRTRGEPRLCTLNQERTLLAHYGARELKIFDIDGTELVSFACKYPGYLAFTPDDRHLAAYFVDDQTVRYFDLEAHTFTHEARIEDEAWLWSRRTNTLEGISLEQIELNGVTATRNGDKLHLQTGSSEFEWEIKFITDIGLFKGGEKLMVVGPYKTTSVRDTRTGEITADRMGARLVAVGEQTIASVNNLNVLMFPEDGGSIPFGPPNTITQFQPIDDDTLIVRYKDGSVVAGIDMKAGRVTMTRSFYNGGFTPDHRTAAHEVTEGAGKRLDIIDSLSGDVIFSRSSDGSFIVNRLTDRLITYLHQPKDKGYYDYYVYDLDTKTESHFASTESGSWLHVSRDCLTYTRGRNDDPISLFDLETGRLIMMVFPLNEARSPVTTADYLVTISRDNVAQVWQIPTGDEIARFERIRSVEVRGDVMRLHGGTFISFWNLRTHTLITPIQSDYAVSWLEMSDDGRLAAARLRKGLEVWDVHANRLCGRMDLPSLFTPVEMAFSADGSLLAVYGHRLDIVETEGVKRVASFEADSVTGMRFVGERLVVGDQAGGIRVYGRG